MKHWGAVLFALALVCAAGDAVEWRSAKSPKMHGRIGRLDGRYLLVWDDEAVDEDAWLAFAGQGGSRTLRMAKFDPDGDFSSDYEDLAFSRVGGCD